MAVVRREYGLLVFAAVLFCCSYALIIPEELRSLAYTISGSFFPGTKSGVLSGTVSRLGFGFRFGKHADFQYVIQLGPQTETQPIGLQPENNGNTKRHYPAGILHSQ